MNSKKQMKAVGAVGAVDTATSKTLPINPIYLRLYSFSNEGYCLIPLLWPNGNDDTN